MKTNKQEGRLTISRPIGMRSQETCIKVSIQSRESLVPIAVVRIPLADFAECLTGLANVSCEIETYG